MESSSDKRVYSGYCKKCDGSQIFVGHSYAKNSVCRMMTKASFCE